MNAAMATTLFGLAMAVTPLAAQPAELKILAGGSMTASMKELGPRFEKATGHKLTFQFAGTPALIKTATSGEAFDAGVVPIAVMKDAAARAKFGDMANVAHVGYGVAFRTGAAKPDVSTPDAFKQTLLKAQSIAFYPESAAGAYVRSVFERLGIADAMQARTRAQKSPGEIPLAVAKGEAELGVFLTNVMIAPGVELAGPFPGDLQHDLVFVGAVAAASKNAEAAKAFLAFLKSPEAIAVFKAKGVTPG